MFRRKLTGKSFLPLISAAFTATVSFRSGTDETDHVIGTEPMQVIWARGQEPGKYVHSPPSGLEKEAALITDFYRPDELKYHGKGDQRGVTVITFIGKFPSAILFFFFKLSETFVLI